MSKDAVLHVRVEHSVKERLEEVARRTKRSKSFLAGEAIEEFLATQEWQIAGIKQGLRSLDAGEGVPHEKVIEWLSSWDDSEELPKPKA